MRDVVITAAVRTPIGAYCGTLRETPVEKLGAMVLNKAISNAGIKPEEVNDVVFSQAYAGGESPNLARLALLSARLAGGGARYNGSTGAVAAE